MVNRAIVLSRFCDMLYTAQTRDDNVHVPVNIDCHVFTPSGKLHDYIKY